MKNIIETIEHLINKYKSDIDKLEAENTRYREALEFYADLGEPSIYIPCLIERPDIYHAPLIEKDMGQIAREALKDG